MHYFKTIRLKKITGVPENKKFETKNDSIFEKKLKNELSNRKKFESLNLTLSLATFVMLF